MVTLSFTIYAQQTIEPALFTVAAPVGFVLDKPLDPDFNQNQPGSVVGNITIPALQSTGELTTTVLVNASEGDHYVILGTKPVKSLLGRTLTQSYTLELSGAGQRIRQTFGGDAGMTVYIAFRVNRDGSLTPLGTGQIAFNGTPITSSGSGGIWGAGTDPSAAIEAIIGPLLQMMLPLMMISMMTQMMAGIVASLQV